MFKKCGVLGNKIAKLKALWSKIWTHIYLGVIPFCLPVLYWTEECFSDDRAMKVNDSIGNDCQLTHYARRYMSNGVIHIQRSFREFVRAFNKFWLVESRFLNTWSCRIVKSCCSLAFRCAMYLLPLDHVSKNQFQPVRICLTHAQIHGMTAGHVSFCWT